MSNDSYYYQQPGQQQAQASSCSQPGQTGGQPGQHPGYQWGYPSGQQAQAGPYVGYPTAPGQPYYYEGHYYMSPTPGQTPTQYVDAGSSLKSWVNVTEPCYLKGLLLGVGVTLLLTNPTVQKTVAGAAFKLWAAVQSSVEEIKEQVEDMKAEMAQKND